MTRFFFSLLTIISVLTTAPVQASEIPPSPIAKATLVIDTVGEPTAAIHFTLPEGWHIYWQNPGDAGLAPTIAWQLPAGVNAGSILWPTPSRHLTDTIVSYGYGDEVTLLVPLTLSDPKAQGAVKAEVKWLVCKEICIPESTTLQGTIPASDGEGVIAKARATLPHIITTTGRFYADEKGVTIALSAKDLPTGAAEFFPIENGILANDGKRSVARDGQTLRFSFDRGYADIPETLSGVVKIDNQGFYIHAERANAPIETSASSGGFLFILLLGFIGGVLLNLMPCVLPILSLKALALAKKSGLATHAVRRQGIAYTAGVITTFLAIAAVLLAVKSLGVAAGWGFQLQQPWFVATLALLMAFVGYNLLGLVELPVLLGSLSTRVKEDGALGSFLTGALAVALATPCTTPFMAPALGATLTLPALQGLLVFAALGGGMAFPFLLISFWPAALRLLPKPGPWMARFKQWIAVPILMTATWLLWVLFNLTGIAGAALTAAAIALLFFLLRLSRAKQWPGVIVSICIILLMAITAFVQPSTALRTVSMPANAVAFDAAKLKALRDAGTPVFVDATATWCITCKVNERVALHTEDVQALFKEKNIVFMVADWTQGDATITDYLASFGRTGVPLYVYYPPHAAPIVLPQLLTISIVRNTVTSP